MVCRRASLSETVKASLNHELRLRVYPCGCSHLEDGTWHLCPIHGRQLLSLLYDRIRPEAVCMIPDWPI